MCSLIALISFVTIIQQTDAVFRTCNSTNSCSGQELICDDNEPDCILQCDGYQNCVNTIYRCTGPNNLCDIRCTSASLEKSCDRLNIFSNASTSIQCDDELACYQLEARIYGNNNAVDVNVTCSAQQSCQSFDIWLYGSSPGNQFNLLCQEDAGWYSCYDTQVHCHFDNSQCQVECQTAPSCFGSISDLYCYNNGIGTTCNIIDVNNVNFQYAFTFDPTNYPTSDPTTDPTKDPTSDPTIDPTIDPTTDPTDDPTSDPTVDPTIDPTTDPTFDPTSDPTIDPTIDPTTDPTDDPTTDPTSDPTADPTTDPSIDPTSDPTTDPTMDPTSDPTIDPTSDPTTDPTVDPTSDPTADPTADPTIDPTIDPTGDPTSDPTIDPTSDPTMDPTKDPTTDPTLNPTLAPSISPSLAPTTPPSAAPSLSPTPRPTHNINERTHGISSNYVMNNAFGINNFKFAAAIDQCMNERIGSNRFIKYECIDENTAIHNIYTDNECTSIVSGEMKIYNSSIDEFVCNGDEDTFVELGLFPDSSDCAGALRHSIFIADNVCTSYGGDGNNHYRLYCQDYEIDKKTYNGLDFEYYHDECSIYGFDSHSYITDEYNDEYNDCYEDETKSLFAGRTDSIFVQMEDCWTYYINLTITTTATAETTKTPETVADESAAYDISGYAVLGSVAVLPTLGVFAAFLFHRKRSGSDRPGYIALFKFFSSIGDFYTDAIWSLSLYQLRNEWWPWAVIFCFGPHVISLICCMFFLTKWRQTRSKQFISDYAKHFDKVIIILSLISGFYATTEIITSHLFHLNVLSLQLGSRERDRILNLKIFNNVILENIPCLFIQYQYLSSVTETSIFDNGINITLVAMAFSITAILFGVLTVTIRVFNGIIELTRRNDLNQIYIDFSFKSSKSDIIKKYHIHSNFLLSEGIALALHIQASQVDIGYIQQISNGIKVNGKIKYLDYNNTKTIIKHLNDINSELYNNFYNECTKRLKIESKCVTLDIINTKSKHQQQADKDDDNDNDDNDIHGEPNDIKRNLNDNNDGEIIFDTKSDDDDNNNIDTNDDNKGENNIKTQIELGTRIKSISLEDKQYTD